MREEKNVIYYFGDLDYEGILIYENFAQKEYVIYEKEGKIQVQPFVLGYVKMIEKARKIGIQQMPKMKQGQNHSIGTKFFNYFSEEVVEVMQQLLENGQYIPQEILSWEDF